MCALLRLDQFPRGFSRFLYRETLLFPLKSLEITVRMRNQAMCTASGHNENWKTAWREARWCSVPPAGQGLITILTFCSPHMALYPFNSWRNPFKIKRSMRYSLQFPSPMLSTGIIGLPEHCRPGFSAPTETSRLFFLASLCHALNLNDHNTMGTIANTITRYRRRSLQNENTHSKGEKR